MKTSAQAILLHERDSVAVAVEDITAGTPVRVVGATTRPREFMAFEGIPRGHKISLDRLEPGDAVVKYGHTIGAAKTRISSGAWVHEHNLGSALGQAVVYGEAPPPFVWTEREHFRTLWDEAGLPRTFQGYRRADGTVGVRNELWIIPTVGCIGKTAENLAQWGRSELGVECWAWNHPFGCSQLGDDLENTRTALAQLARHPNAAAVLVLSLGCENLRLEHFQSAVGPQDPNRVSFLNLQDVGDEIEAAHERLKALAATVKAQTRVELPLSELRLGLKCGGSDGFSGLTANPLVGRVTDLLVANGGSAVMTEVPEMFGAETELMARAASPEVYRGIQTMVEDFKAYFRAYGQEVDENPSPGNRDGGITTLEEKSLGCIRKAGGVPVAGVQAYAHRASAPGLTLVSGPGNDQVSTTNLAAAGAQVILFTTGRGTPYGAAVPTLKISSNSTLARKKPHWIDFDAGVVLGGRSFDQAAVELMRLVLATAGGQAAKAEATGHRDIALFKTGVTL
jgi:altronate hydrolase